MKDFILNFVFVALLISPSLSIDLVSQQKDVKKQRKLSETDLLSERLLENEHKISVQKLSDEIKDLHKNVKLCIDAEFAKEPADILLFEDILRLCVGDNYSIVLRFYADINFEVKEITKEKVKNKLKDGFCDNKLFQCISYFKAMELFIDKDFDLLKSIELNKKELERKIDPEHLDYLVKLTQDEISDYETVRKDLLDERRYLTEYFRERYEEYLDKYGEQAVEKKNK